MKNQAVEKHYFDLFSQFLNKQKINYVDEVDRQTVDKFESLLLARMKASSVNRRFNTFKNFFAKCLEWKFIFENPCQGMKKRKEETNSKIPWTEEIFLRFLKECNSELKMIAQFLWLTGCRPMEIRNLRWSDVHHDEGFLIFRCGKNAEVSRRFPIFPELDQLLHKMKMRGPFVFLLNGKQVNNDRLYHAFKVRLKSIGLGQYTVYGLRHGFGTRLANQGVSAFYIAELMGHSKVETTRKYVHSEKKHLIKVLSKARSL